jgi:hypothetical protein
MGVLGALAGSAGGTALGKFGDKKLSTRKDGGETKYGKYLQTDIGKKLNLATVGGIAGKALGALLPFQKGGMVTHQMMMDQNRKLPTPKIGYRLSQGIDPRTY